MGKRRKPKCNGNQHAAYLRAAAKRRAFKAQEAKKARKKRRGK